MKFEIIKNRTYSTIKRCFIRYDLYNYSQSNYNLDENDVFLVSYPKSGNTYARFLIANTFSKTPHNFFTIEKHIPDIYQVRPNKINTYKKYGIIKSHERYNDEYRNVIYIIRDPRNVVLSYAYWHYRNLGVEYVTNNINQIVLDWLNIKSGMWAWEKHVTEWTGQIENKRVNGFFAKYEDITYDPKKFIIECLKLSKLDTVSSNIDRGILFSSKKIMNAGEEHIKPYIVNKKGAFVGLDKKPTFNDLVSNDVKSKFYDDLGLTMKRLNYV